MSKALLDGLLDDSNQLKEIKPREEPPTVNPIIPFGFPSFASALYPSNNIENVAANFLRRGSRVKGRRSQSQRRRSRRRSCRR